MWWVLVWALVDIYLGYSRKEGEKATRELWAIEMKKRVMKKREMPIESVLGDGGDRESDEEEGDAD